CRSEHRAWFAKPTCRCAFADSSTAVDSVVTHKKRAKPSTPEQRGSTGGPPPGIGWKPLLLDHITNRPIALQPALVHPGQHQNVVVHIVVDLHESFVVVQPTTWLLRCLEASPHPRA